MSKILNKYENGLDKAWYQSSNILYSECDDKEDELKVVRITFKDGRTYEYKDVNVHEYLRFRESPSQGSVFSQLIKHNPSERINNRSVEEIENELKELLEPSETRIIKLTDTSIILQQGQSKIVIENFKELSLRKIIENISTFFSIRLEDETSNDCDR